MTRKREPGRKRSGKAGKGAEPSAKDYEVGYGKPPVSGQFVKGRSGNPRGRPRKFKPQPPKLSDAPSDWYLENEAYKPIELMENGRKVELSGVQAVMRALKINALKGSRLSQKYFLEYVREEEERQLKRKVDNYFILEKLKRDGEALIAERKRKGLPPPDLLPHPDDIVLNRARGEAYVNGPETQEDLKDIEHRVRMRDLAALCWAHTDKHLTTRRGRDDADKDKICMHAFIAYTTNRFLPQRFRWQDREDEKLVMQYLGMSKKERERLIERETAELKATQPPSTLSPEVQTEIDRIVDQFMRNRGSEGSAAA